jgi:hypothetical protein
MRTAVIEQATTASLRKASKFRLVGGVLNPDFIEATPDARWERFDPFQHFLPVGDRSGDPCPHEMYAKLGNMAEHMDSTAEMTELFHMAIVLFVNKFGLLGWFGEEFGAPILPRRALSGFVRLAPDTVIDEGGTLRSIDPATEGKQLLERLMVREDEQGAAELGIPPSRPSDYYLEPKELILPSELRFTRPPTDFVRTGITDSAYFKRDKRIYSYEAVQSRYGIRVVFDPESSATGVTILPTREPMNMWQMLIGIGKYVSKEYLNRQLHEVSPLIVVGQDGTRMGGWNCSSLLKAVHLMYFLDLLTNVELKKCQAPGCFEYFRVEPRSGPRMYCSPPPGRKQSKCASRATSAMYRERQRRNS